MNAMVTRQLYNLCLNVSFSTSVCRPHNK